MNDELVIQELNESLKGEYMGIHAFEHYIYHTKDPKIKEVLQKIQQDHKRHAAKLAERIQNLGGKASEDNGIKASISEWMMKMKGFPTDTEKIIEEVLKGQQMGIEASEKIVRDDLDPESRQVVENNLSEDREHIDLLNQLLH